LLLLLDFFDDEDLEDFFDAAMSLTTFHAVRDLPVAPTWQYVPECSGKFECGEVGMRGETAGRPSTVARRLIQFLAIVIFAFVNMRSINHIVKHLFIEIVIRTRCSTMFHAER